MARFGPLTLAGAVALIVVLAGGSATADAAAARASDAALATTQLPRGIRPLHYDVALVPHAATLTFEGRATVTIDVAAPTRRITLNAVGLAFSSVRLLPASGPSTGVAAAAIDVDAAAQTATFSFARPIPAGRHRLAMTYAGAIGTQANGLFAIDYDTPRGRERALFTQFENVERAPRRAVVGRAGVQGDLRARGDGAGGADGDQQHAGRLDRPGRRAASSASASRPRRGCRPTCSSSASATSSARPCAKARTEVGVVARRGAIAQAQFALEASQRILRDYNEYFAIPYPLPKLDNVASPGGSQFFSAMENWGAIYSFERILLIDPTISTQADRQRVFAIAAHEIAHQWFGNLVTMRWWDDIWLNEGFATWMPVAHGRQAPSRVAELGRRRAPARRCDGPGRVRDDAPDRPARRDGRPGEPGLRLDHLLEGRRRDRDARELRRRRCLARGRARLPQGSRLRQRRHRRPLARDRARGRQADRRHRPRLHAPARHPARPRRAPRLRRRRDDAAPDAGRVRRRSSGEGAAALARSGDRARRRPCAGAHDRRRRQRRSGRSGLRPRRRQCRPERLLPHRVLGRPAGGAPRRLRRGSPRSTRSASSTTPGRSVSPGRRRSSMRSS